VKTVAEGAGAAGVAALMNNTHWDLGKNCAVIISGGNIDLDTMAQVIQTHQPSSQDPEVSST